MVLSARLAAAVLLAATLLAGAPAARADAYLRVIAQHATVRSGPGADYRDIYRADRGEVFSVIERGTKGYWFRVRLEDGTAGWIIGDAVFPFEVVDEENPGLFTRMWRATRRAILGPSPVPGATVELSFSAGVLGGEGLFLLRPAVLLEEHIAFEGFLGSNPRAQEDLFLGGVGWTLRLVPGAALGPYVNAGVGAAHFRPKADNFDDVERTLLAVSAGGGFEITFKKQITVRVDFRNWTIFDPDEASNSQEYSGGLEIFF